MKTSSIGKALSDRYGYGDMKEIARQIIRDENRKDSSPISNTSKAWRKLDQFLNLGSTKDLSLSDLSTGKTTISQNALKITFRRSGRL